MTTNLKRLAQVGTILFMLTTMLGCAKTSGIVDATKYKSYFEGTKHSGQFLFVNSDKFLEQKKFRIFEQGATGSISLSSLKAKAFYSASFFCSNKKGNPRVVVITEMTSEPPHILGNFPRYELVFTCLQQEDEPFHIKNKNEQTTQNSKYDQIKLVKELLDSGAITKEEYAKEKAKLLNQ